MAGPDPYADIAEPLSSASPELPKVPKGDPSPDVVDRYAGIAEPVPQGNQVGQIEKFSQGALGGITEFGAVIPAVIAGTKVGATIGALGGPFAPITVPAGAAIGGIGSGLIASYSGKELRELGSKIPNPFGEGMLMTPKAEGSAQVSGEIFGGGIIGGGGMVAVAKTGLRFGNSRVGAFVNGIIDSAKNTPRSFLAAETAAATGAAVGGGSSELVLPDNEFARFVAETAGGFASPTRLFASPVMFLRDKLSAVGRVVLPGRAGEIAAENKAASIIGELLNEYGEDPIALREALDLAGIEKVTGPTTTAAITESKAIADLQERLIEMNKGLGPQIRETISANIENMSRILKALTDSGDPELIKTAAQARQRMFDSLLQGRLDVVERRAKEAALNLKSDTTASRSDISKLAVDLAGEALSDARKIERDLWTAVERNIPLNGQDDIIANTISRLKSERLLRGDNLDPSIEAFLSDSLKKQNLIEAGESVPENLIFNSNELLKLKTKTLELSRQASAVGDYAKANIYNTIADDVMDSLDGLYQGDGSYDTARAFSRALNDTFTRTFAGRVSASDKSGASRIAPEVALRQALAGGNEASAMKFQQLSDATRFLDTQKIVSVEQFDNLSEQMMDAQEDFLNIIVSEAVDPETGIASASRLKGIFTKNSELFDRFPDIKNRVEKAISSQRDLTELVQAQKQSNIALKQSAFAKILGVDNPSDAIKKAVNSDKPITELTRLAKFGARTPEAKQGLASAAITYALNSSFKKDGSIDFVAFQQALDGAIGDSGESVLSILKKQNIIDDSVVKTIDDVLNAAQALSKSQTGAAAVVPSLENANMLVNLIARVGGSSLTRGAARVVGLSGSGASLIQAQAGSQAGRKLLERIPAAKVMSVLAEAMVDPKLMKMLLEKPESTKANIKLLKQLHGYFYAAGYLALSDEE